MTLASLFRLSVYLLVLSSHFSLILTPEMPLGHAALLLFLLAAAWFYGRGDYHVPRLFFNSLLILLLLFSLAYGLFLAEYFFKAVIYFLAYVLAIRMFSLESSRDIWLVFLLSFFELCAASILTIHINFLLGLFLYLGLAGFSLMLFNLKREMESLSAGEKPGQARRLRPTFMALTAGTAAAVFIIGFLLFFLLPRIGRGFISWRTRMHPQITGFSDSVRLGDVGPMYMNQMVVMRVHIRGEDSPRPEPMYWRGAALDYYDGATWMDLQDVKAVKYYGVLEAQVKKPSSLEGQETADFYLEPTDTPILFAPEGVVSFRLPSKFRRIVIYNNDYYGLNLKTAVFDRIQYQTYFRTPKPDPERLSRAYEGVDRQRLKEDMFDYLLYPPELDPVCELAEAEIDPEEDPYSQSLSIMRFLDERYTYTTSPPATSTDNPLGEFMFETRQGYCEHFATAMAIMLRCLDVPTRIVTGFSEGEWNPYENYYIVRQSDAHAWVEVYFPDSEWVRFDPSPPSGRRQRLGFRKRMAQVVDSIYFRWNRWVVDYSVFDQVRGFRMIQNRGFKLSREFLIFSGSVRFRVRQALARPGMLVAIAIIAGLAIVIWAFFRKPGAQKESELSFDLGPEQKLMIRNYMKMLALLGKAGFLRRESQTAREFAEEVVRQAPGLRTVARITKMYEDVRFGLKPFHREQGREFRDALSECKRALRSRA